MPWTQQLPSGKWRALYRDGVGKPRSAGTFPHKKAAVSAAAVAEAAARSLGWHDPKSAERPWGEWCTAWWPTRPVEPGTLARDVSPRDKHLMTRWAGVPLIEITRHDVKAWATTLRQAGLADASVQRHVHLFSASLSAAVDAEILTANPAYRLKLPSGQTDMMRFLTQDEARLLLAKMDNPGFVALLLGTGLRWGEAAGLQSKRVDLERGVIRVAEVWDDKTNRLKAYPKGRKIRDVPIPDWVAEYLDLKSGFIFESMDYANWRNREWQTAVDDSGIGHVRPHDCRHTYASWLIQEGVSLAEVGRLLGHVSPTTTQRYAHLADVPREHILRALRDPRVANV